MAVPHLPFFIAPQSYCMKNVILCYNICLLRRSRKQHYCFLAENIKAKISPWSVSLSLPVSQNLPSRQTPRLCVAEWQMYSTNLLPLCVPLPPCVGFVRKKGMNNWEGQQAAVWVGQICRHGVPPCLPASTFLWILLCVVSDAEAGAGMSLSKSRVGMPGLHIVLQK